ncbi:MAG: deoxycytidylate deaminase [Nitrosopumilus sp. D6]|nr:MAG: deoxycytidylate deaminase [Nitrosopumilus sp. D6]
MILSGGLHIASNIFKHTPKQPVGNFERPDWDEYFMLQAELAKLRSNCLTRQVGAVIVRNNRQIATGYNGTPPGIKNCYEGGCQRCKLRMEGKIESGASLERCLCNHAEANAIMHCAILGIEAGKGAILYTTFVPCLECTKMAVTIGIKKFICLDSYPETNQDLIDEAGVKIVRLEKGKIARWAENLASKYKESA